MKVQLFYWPTIQGRGEFVRLLLEETKTDYEDVARSGAEGLKAMRDAMSSGDPSLVQPLSPPFVKIDGLPVVFHVANILLVLGNRLGLGGKTEDERVVVNQLQLSIADLVSEIHDGHHPIAVSLYYEDQKQEAARRTVHLVTERIPKYLKYFESILVKNSLNWLVGDGITYVDLSMFQVLVGLEYAFPKAMTRLSQEIPCLMKLKDSEYLASTRRIPFNENGIFRHYSELDL
ncbi:putative glutathione S-transferase [Obelidium mucronatum]|nr:putative glutathione S-transferase [Obelidium mucronatum]